MTAAERKERLAFLERQRDLTIQYMVLPRSMSAAECWKRCGEILRDVDALYAADKSKIEGKR